MKWKWTLKVRVEELFVFAVQLHHLRLLSCVVGEVGWWEAQEAWTPASKKSQDGGHHPVMGFGFLIWGVSPRLGGRTARVVLPGRWRECYCKS